MIDRIASLVLKKEDDEKYERMITEVKGVSLPSRRRREFVRMVLF